MSRPAYHFTPQKGWINDPNGLIKIDEDYHLFYQHYPDDTHWGPMHWGHTISKDLTNWEHLPIAIYPTEDEYAFSGSAILDTENVSGLGENALLLFYTGHNPKTGEQVQCLAYSSDYVNYTKYENNPIITNYVTNGPSFKKDFRDPKVIPNKILGGYTMLLAAGDGIEFWNSRDLLHWEFASFFDANANGITGICECPDLITFNIEETDISVLTMSIVNPRENEPEEHFMPYFVGVFDGKAFSLVQKYDNLSLLDFGPHNYAAVTFANCASPIIMGWGEDWNEARVNTNEDYFGKMTLARSLTLKKVGNYYRLSQKIVSNAPFEEITLNKTQPLSNIEGIELKLDPNEVNFFYISINNNSVRVPRFLKGDLNIQVYRDYGYVEIIAEDGLVSFSISN